MLFSLRLKDALSNGRPGARRIISLLFAPFNARLSSGKSLRMFLTPQGTLALLSRIYVSGRVSASRVRCSRNSLLPHQREEVLWRTGTSKQTLGTDTAWKRTKMVEKELSSIADRMRPFHANSRTTSEAVDLYIQSLYVSTNCIATS